MFVRYACTKDVVCQLAQPANDNWTGLPPKVSTADQFRPDSWYGVMKGMAEIPV